MINNTNYRLTLIKSKHTITAYSVLRLLLGMKLSCEEKMSSSGTLILYTLNFIIL